MRYVLCACVSVRLSLGPVPGEAREPASAAATAAAVALHWQPRRRVSTERSASATQSCTAEQRRGNVMIRCADLLRRSILASVPRRASTS
jgi:hypothetical protein